MNLLDPTLLTTTGEMLFDDEDSDYEGGFAAPKTPFASDLAEARRPGKRARRDPLDDTATTEADDPERQRLILQHRMDLLRSRQEMDNLQHNLIERIRRDPRYAFMLDVFGATGRGGTTDPMMVFDTSRFRGALEDIKKIEAMREETINLLREAERTKKSVHKRGPRIERSQLNEKLDLEETKRRIEDRITATRTDLAKTRTRSAQLESLAAEKLVHATGLLWWKGRYFQAQFEATNGLFDYTKHTAVVLQDVAYIDRAKGPSTSFMESLGVTINPDSLVYKMLGEIFKAQISSASAGNSDLDIAEVLLDLALPFIMPMTPTLNDPEWFVGAPLPSILDYRIFSALLHQPFMFKTGSVKRYILPVIIELLEANSTLYRSLKVKGVGEERFHNLFALYSDPPTARPESSLEAESVSNNNTITNPVIKPVRAKRGAKSSGGANSTFDTEMSEARFKPTQTLSAGRVAKGEAIPVAIASPIRQKTYIGTYVNRIPGAKKELPWISQLEDRNSDDDDEDVEAAYNLFENPETDERTVDFAVFSQCLQEALVTLVSKVPADSDALYRPRSRNILNFYLDRLGNDDKVRSDFVKNVITQALILIDGNVFFQTRSTEAQPSLKNTLVQRVTEPQLCVVLIREFTAWLSKQDVNLPENQLINISDNIRKEASQGPLDKQFVIFLRQWYANAATLTNEEISRTKPFTLAEWNFGNHVLVRNAATAKLPWVASTGAANAKTLLEPKLEEFIEKKIKATTPNIATFDGLTPGHEAERSDFKSADLLCKLGWAGVFIDDYLNDFLVQEVNGYRDQLQLNLNESERYLQTVRDEIAELTERIEAVDMDGGDDVSTPPAFETKPLQDLIDNLTAQITRLKAFITTAPFEVLSHIAVAVQQAYAFIRGKPNGEWWTNQVCSAASLMTSSNAQARSLFASIVREILTNSEQRSGSRAVYQQRSYYDLAFIAKNVAADRLLAIKPHDAVRGGSLYKHKF